MVEATATATAELIHRPYRGWLYALRSRPCRVAITGDQSEYVLERIRRSGDFYESDVLSIASCLDPKPGLAIDIGAHIGNHTLYFAVVMGRQVISIEPCEGSRQLLHQNIEDNGVNGACTVIASAVSDAEGSCSIVFSDGANAVTGHMFPGDDTRVARLDDLIAETAPSESVGLIKIDVEGFAVQALQGGVETIRQHRPLIIAELDPADELPAACAQLAPLGYRFVGPYGRSPTYLFTTRRWTRPLRRHGYRIWRSYQRGRLRHLLQRLWR